jgi:hypothetical protein
MQGDAIQLVGDEMGRRIAAATAPRQAGDPAAVSVYHGPLDVAAAAAAQLVLFPIRTLVNADLRNGEHRAPPAAAGGEVVYDAALPLDVHFLLCANPVLAGDGEWLGAQYLGRAMQALNGPAGRFGLLVEGELVHLSLDFTSTEDMGRIWALFPAINYRTSVVYLATPVWIDPLDPTLTGPPVVYEKYAPRPIQPALEPT